MKARALRTRLPGAHDRRASLLLLLIPDQITRGHLGLLMLGLIVVAILLGFPTAFTLMGLGMVFGFIAFYRARAAVVRQSRSSTRWCCAPSA